MLNSKSDYRFFTFPSDTVVNGNIIPKIEVNGGVAESIRLEDIGFLYEWLKQINTFYQSTSSKSIINDKIEKSKLQYILSYTQDIVKRRKNYYTDGFCGYHLSSGLVVPTSYETGIFDDSTLTFYGGNFTDKKTTGCSVEDTIAKDLIRRIYSDLSYVRWVWARLNDSASEGYITGSWRLDREGTHYTEQEHVLQNFTNLKCGQGLPGSGTYYSAYPTLRSFYSSYRYDNWKEFLSTYITKWVVDTNVPLSTQHYYIQLRFTFSWVGNDHRTSHEKTLYKLVELEKINGEWCVPSGEYSESRIRQIALENDIPIIEEFPPAAEPPYTVMRNGFSCEILPIQGELVSLKGIVNAEIDSLGWEY